MKFQLYQLTSNRQMHRGDYVAVNGLWDRYGHVLSSTRTEKGYLNLVRGCLPRPDEKPVYQF